MTGDLIGTIVIVGLASIGLLWLFNKALGFVYSAVSSWMDRRRLMLRTVLIVSGIPQTPSLWVGMPRRRPREFLIRVPIWYSKADSLSVRVELSKGVPL